MARPSPALTRAHFDQALKRLATKDDLARLDRKVSAIEKAMATKDDLTEVAKHFNRTLLASTSDLQAHLYTVERRLTTQLDAVLEAVHELHGDQIRHAQEAIVDLARRTGAADLR